MLMFSDGGMILNHVVKKSLMFINYLLFSFSSPSTTSPSSFFFTCPLTLLTISLFITSYLYNADIFCI